MNQRTPHGPESVVRYGRKLQRAIAKAGPNDKLEVQQVERFVRGSVASAHALDLTARDLHAMQEAASSRQKRAVLGGQVASQGGIIKVSQCRELCSKRKQKEEEKAKRKKAREEKAAEKKKDSQLNQIAFLINDTPLVD